MQWNKFIFSNKQDDRLIRHTAFWLAWWLYFWLSSYFLFAPIVFTQKAKELAFWNWNLNDFIRSFFLVLIHVAAVYMLLYYLLPKFGHAKKYLHFALGIVSWAVMLFAAAYACTQFIFPLIDHICAPNIERIRKNTLWAATDNGLLSAIKISMIAIAIKLIKYWWVKQKEKERLEREKLNAELQLLKAQIRPDFLFSTLDNIRQYAESSPAKAPGMLIQLSDLLSYILYDCEAPKIRLEKEIDMLKTYMGLEKIRRGTKLDLTIQSYGKTNGQMIGPLLLLPFIDNCLSYCNSEEEQAWISVELMTEENYFSMKLINGLPGNMIYNESPLENVKKRLQLLYPGRHEIKINAEKEMLMTFLKLNLEKTFHKASLHLSDITTFKTIANHAGI